MTAAMTKPRPGSSIDKAMRAIEAEGAPMSRAALAALIEHDDDEVDGLLRFGVRMGLLARTEDDGQVFYALGDGVPLQEPEPAPVAAPAPAQPAPRLVTVGGSNLDVIPSTRRAASTVTSDASSTGPRQLWPGGYTTKVGGQAERLLQHLQSHAPCGGEFWISSRDLADATHIARGNVQALLMGALRHGAARMRHIDGGRVAYQLGNGLAAGIASAAPAVEVVAEPAAPAPSPAPAAPVQHRESTDDATTDRLVEATTELLAHLDMEIARLEHNLRVVRRRRESFKAMVAGQGAKAA